MNTRPAYSPPNAEPEPVVEVPAVGTVLVEEGEQYSVRNARTEWHVCSCTNGKHPAWPGGLNMYGYVAEAHARRAIERGRRVGHVVPVTTYTVVEEVPA